MMPRLLRITMLAALFSLVVAQGNAENWETITSGWNPERIITVDGVAYAASPGGILRVNMATYDLELLNTQDGLANNNPNVVVEDPETGYLWVGYEEGDVDVFDAGSFELVQRIRDFRNDPFILSINDLCIHGDQVFVAHTEGFSRLQKLAEDDVWVVLETLRGFGTWARPLEVNRLAVHDGQVFVGTAQGIAHASLDANLLDVNEWQLHDMHEDLGVDEDEDSWIISLKEARNALYAAPRSGTLHRFDGSSFVAIDEINNIYDFTIDEQGQLYLARYSGLYRYSEDSGLQRVDDDYTPKFFDVTYQDGTLWCCVDTNPFYFGGIVSFREEEGFTAAYPNTPGGDQILHMEATERGDLWVAARGPDIKGVYRYTDGVWYPYAKPNYPQWNFNYQLGINAIEMDPTGGVWCGVWGEGAYYLPRVEGTYDSLYVLGADNTPMRDVEDGSGSYVVVSGFARDPGGGFWLTNQEAYDGSSLVYIPPEWFSVPFEERSHDSWVFFGPEEGLNSPFIGPIEVDGQGRLWLGSITASADYALIMLDPNGTPSVPDDDNYEYYTSARAGYTYLHDMEMSSEGTLWLGTPSGLFYFETSSAPATSSFTQVFGTNDQAINSLELDPMNQVWVGTDFGVRVLDRDRFTWISEYTTEDGRNPSPLVADRVTSMAFDAALGTAYFGTESGISALQTPYRAFSGELDEVRVAPQPFLIGDDGASLQFSDRSLVPDAKVRIYTPSGRLIRTLTFVEASFEGWDGRDEAGEWVASGIYMLLVTGPDGKSSTGKVAVVRQ